MTELINLIPEKYRPWVLGTIAISPYVTRSIYALMHGGGIKGILTSIWLGTNTPKPKPENKEQGT